MPIRPGTASGKLRIDEPAHRLPLQREANHFPIPLDSRGAGGIRPNPRDGAVREVQFEAEPSALVAPEHVEAEAHDGGREAEGPRQGAGRRQRIPESACDALAPRRRFGSGRDCQVLQILGPTQGAIRHVEQTILVGSRTMSTGPIKDQDIDHPSISLDHTCPRSLAR